jgi:predicted HTH transcriptional regulator
MTRAFGTGGMFVQSIKLIESHRGSKKEVSIYRQENTPTSNKLAKMNLAIRDISTNFSEIHQIKNRKMPEQQNIEYKQSWHDEYLKWVCGFANAIGGIIYIGIDNKGNVAHLSNYAKLMEDIPNKIRNAMGIICDIQLEDKEGMKYISIKVNPYSVAVSLRGRYYYRTGSTKMELTGVELNEFLLKKTGKTWDDVVEEGATIKDID